MKKNTKIFILISVIIVLILIIANWKKFFQKVVKPISAIIQTPIKNNYFMDLHPAHADQFEKFTQRVEDETDYTLIYTSGYRSFAEQEKLYNQNNQNAKPGYSMHNYGMAIDINATNGTNYLSKSDTKVDWESSGIPAIAKDMGFTWGGDFKTYHDPVHIGLDGKYNTSTLRALAFNQFGSDPNNIFGNQINLA